MLNFHPLLFLLSPLAPHRGCQGACHDASNALQNNVPLFVLLLVISLAIPIMSVILVKRQERRKLKANRAWVEQELLRLNEALHAAETALNQEREGSRDYQRAEQQKQSIEQEIAELRGMLERVDAAL